MFFPSVLCVFNAQNLQFEKNGESFFLYISPIFSFPYRKWNWVIETFFSLSLYIHIMVIAKGFYEKWGWSDFQWTMFLSFFLPSFYLYIYKTEFEKIRERSVLKIANGFHIFWAHLNRTVCLQVLPTRKGSNLFVSVSQGHFLLKIGFWPTYRISKLTFFQLRKTEARL